MRVRVVWQAMACLVAAAIMTSCDNATAPIVTVNPPSTPVPGPTATPTASGVTVTITIGGGDGTGIVKASPIGPNYPPGTVVTLTAVADAGSCFGGWTASCETFGQKATCTVTISASTKVGAEFDKACSGPTPVYCHAMSSATCPSGATQFCDSVPIVATSSTQAQMACDTCFGAGCSPGVGYFYFSTPGPGFYNFVYQTVSCGVTPWNPGDITDLTCSVSGRWAP